VNWFALCLRAWFGGDFVFRGSVRWGCCCSACHRGSPGEVREGKVPPRPPSRFECGVRNHGELTVTARRCVWQQKLDKSRLAACCR